MGLACDRRSGRTSRCPRSSPTLPASRDQHTLSMRKSPWACASSRPTAAVKYSPQTRPRARARIRIGACTAQRVSYIFHISSGLFFDFRLFLLTPLDVNTDGSHNDSSDRCAISEPDLPCPDVTMLVARGLQYHTHDNTRATKSREQSAKPPLSAPEILGSP